MKEGIAMHYSQKH